MLCNVNAIAMSDGRGSQGWLDAAKLLGTRRSMAGMLRGFFLVECSGESDRHGDQA